jgi:hypothetical protein
MVENDPIGASPPSFAALQKIYSITSSVATWRVFGTWKPRALAAFRLITSSYLSEINTGKAARSASLL